MFREQFLSTARARFEAARCLPFLAGDAPAARRHGHGFEVSAFRPLHSMPSGRGEQLAGELTQSLAAATAPLDYADLNEVLDHPDDAELARWLQQRLDGTNEWIALASTPSQGVSLVNDRLEAWRGFRFEAAHQLPNVPLGHKCGRMHGHGFGVRLHRALGPARDEAPLYEPLESAWTPLGATLDRACLNDLRGLGNPTSERLAEWIFARGSQATDDLAAVEVRETATSGCRFDGSRHRIWKRFTLDSAVRLSAVKSRGTRRRMYGHTFEITLHLTGGVDEVLGWVQDFGDVKDIFRPVYRALDHRPLFEHAELAGGDTASLAHYVRRVVSNALPKLCRIDVMATPGTGTILLLDTPADDFTP